MTGTRITTFQLKTELYYVGNGKSEYIRQAASTVDTFYNPRLWWWVDIDLKRLYQRLVESFTARQYAV